jgi:hypothetical protein
MGEPFIYADGVPETYATEAEAIAVLEETIAEDMQAVEDGFLEDVTEPSEFRIVFLGD